MSIVTKKNQFVLSGVNLGSKELMGEKYYINGSDCFIKVIVVDDVCVHEQGGGPFNSCWGAMFL